MKDLADELIKAYYDKLNNIVVGSFTVPFYDIVPTGASHPYIHVTDFTSNDVEDKTEFGQEVTLTINIVSKYGHKEGGRKDTDDISDKVIQDIRTRSSGYLSLTNHYIITTTLDNTLSFITEIEGGKLITRSIRFRHIIGEN